MPRGVYFRTKQNRINIGLATKGRKNPYLSQLNKTMEHRELVRKTMQNRVVSQEEKTMRRIISIKNGNMPPHKKGKDHYNWRGGITPIVEKIRKSVEYRQWRITIFERDKYTCQICGLCGIIIRANHIKKFCDYPELRLVLTNGITICERCDLKYVMYHEYEWESYFNFNLMTRGFLSDDHIAEDI